MTVIKQQATDSDVLWTLPTGGSFIIADETGTELFRVTAVGDTVKVAGTLNQAGTAQLGGTAITATATELNLLDGAGAVVASGTVAENIADVADDNDFNGTFDDEELEAAVNANAGAINDILAALLAFGIMEVGE